MGREREGRGPYRIASDPTSITLGNDNDEPEKLCYLCDSRLQRMRFRPLLKGELTDGFIRASHAEPSS